MVVDHENSPVSSKAHWVPQNVDMDELDDHGLLFEIIAVRSVTPTLLSLWNQLHAREECGNKCKVRI